MGERGDGELVRSARRGERGAFEELVGRYHRRLVGLAWRLLSDRDEAMEIAQDALLKAYENLSGLSHPDRFGAWVMRIAANLSLNRRRARALRKAASLDAPAGPDGSERLDLPDPSAASPADEASAADLERRIEQVLDELPPLQRQALVLFSIEKMPQKDVAQVMECSEENVRWNVFAARKKLRERLKEYL